MTLSRHLKLEVGIQLLGMSAQEQMQARLDHKTGTQEDGRKGKEEDHIPFTDDDVCKSLLLGGSLCILIN